MTVDYHIRQLLFRNDCVIIPGFGAFLVKKISAKVDVEADLLVPPKRVLSFNPQLKNDDGLLISYVSIAEKISYKEAQIQVVDFVEELTHAIQQKKEVLVEDLGKFSINKDNFLSFESIATKNYLLSAFGLEEVSVSKAIAEEQLAYSDTTKSVPEIEDTKVISLAPKENQKEVRRLGWAKYAAVFTGIIIFSGFLGWKYQQNKYFQQEQLAQQRVEQKVQTHLQEANFYISPFTTPIEIELPKEAINFSFHVVGGAFRSEANAYKKVAQLKDQGFDAKQIGQNKYGLYQVAYQSFVTRGEALEMLKKVRESDNPSAWLLVE